MKQTNRQHQCTVLTLSIQSVASLCWTETSLLIHLFAPFHQLQDASYIHRRHLVSLAPTTEDCERS